MTALYSYFLSNKDYYFSKIYFFSLAGVCIGLAIWPLLISISFFTFVIAWLSEGLVFKKFPVFFSNIKKNKFLLLISAVYIIHLLGLFNTSNFQYAFHDLNIKLPMLFFPVIIASINNLKKIETKLLLTIFLASMLIATFISLYRLVFLNLTDIRHISKISYIRFALLLNIAIFSSFAFISHYFNQNRKIYLIFIALAIWFCIILLIIKSLSGLLIFFILTIIYLIKFSRKSNNRLINKALLIFAYAIPLITFVYIALCVKKFYNIESIDKETIALKTVNGALYEHNFDYKFVENGHYIGLYFCDIELYREWTKRSKKDYISNDDRGQMIKYTLIRYLTSKGLAKDSAGLWQLTDHDIKLIESGITNYIYENKLRLYPRIYQTIWEIDVYLKGGDPSGHSITQRLEFLKTGWYILKNNIVFGVGTGDVPVEFKNAYNKLNSKLKPEFRLRAHNQFLTFFISFGIPLGVLACILLIYPAFYKKRIKNYFVILIFCTGFISMLNEDTLETQAGVTLFVFFYTIFLRFDFSEIFEKNYKNSLNHHDFNK